MPNNCGGQGSKPLGNGVAGGGKGPGGVLNRPTVMGYRSVACGAWGGRAWGRVFNQEQQFGVMAMAGTHKVNNEPRTNVAR